MVKIGHVITNQLRVIHCDRQSSGNRLRVTFQHKLMEKRNSPLQRFFSCRVPTQ